MRYICIGVALLIGSTACTSGEKRSDTVVSATPTNADRARAVANVANAIAVNPTKADSILTAAGYTRDNFQNALYEIAADSAMSAVYEATKKS